MALKRASESRSICSTSIRSSRIRDLSPYRVLSNKLILQAQEEGMPMRYLAFNDEDDFLANLTSEKPNKVDVGIVRLRNNICHGNVIDFVNVDLGPDNSYFSPELLKTVTEQVLTISADWCLVTMTGQTPRNKRAWLRSHAKFADEHTARAAESPPIRAWSQTQKTFSIF